MSLGELLQRIDGPIAPLPCLSRRSYQRCDDCSDEDTCQLRRVFGEIFWSYLLLIESLTLADLLQTPGKMGQTLGLADNDATVAANGTASDSLAGE